MYRHPAYFFLSKQLALARAIKEAAKKELCSASAICRRAVMVAMRERGLVVDGVAE
jgi:hypothetical protein